MVQQYEEAIEPKLKPEYMAKLDRIEKQDAVVIGSPSDFRKRYGI